MSRINLLLGILFSFFLYACGSTKPTTTTTSTTTTSEEPVITSPETMKPGTYEITVLNPDLASPRKEMKGMIESALITVNYGSPSVKGRTVWGGLAPFGKVWRTGANEATTFTTSKDITFQGKKIPAGKYGLFTIPNEGDWTVILNMTSDQWGAYEYDQSKDVLRVSVTPQVSSENVEAMDFIVEGNALVLKWEKLSVPVEIGE